jgi:hypothetical protein
VRQGWYESELTSQKRINTTLSFSTERKDLVTVITRDAQANILQSIMFAKIIVLGFRVESVQ